MKDELTLFTTATFVDNNSMEELKNSLLLCCLPFQFNMSTVRVHCSFSIQNLVMLDSLVTHRIILTGVGLTNINDHTIANTANLEAELFKLDASGNPVSAPDLLRIVCMLNSRIHPNGLSSRQMLTDSRRGLNKHCLQFTDQLISDKQEDFHVASYPFRTNYSKLLPFSRSQAYHYVERKKKVTASPDSSSDCDLKVT